MLQPLRPSPRTQEISRSYLIPASTKGWVQNQAIARMDPESAYQLDNWYPEATGLRLRRGNQLWVNTGSNGPVETMASFLTGANRKLFAFSVGDVYDVTGSGVATIVHTGNGSNRWNCINYANAAGNWLICVNGVDPPMAFNGSTWVFLAITGPANINKLNFVWEYQGTLFFCEAGTQNFWYLAPGAVQGAATSFPLGPLLNKGGAVLVGGQWTFTTAYSILNLCIFISTEGEVLVYQGNNPSSASTWALTAQFVIGRPIGNRCLLNINSDMIVLCEDGLMPLSKALQYDRPEAARNALTWNIQDAFNVAYQASGQMFGWQILGFPFAHAVIVNIPQSASGQSVQFLENVSTGAWCRFLGVEAVCWCCQQDALYWGDYSGVVWQGDSGSADGANGSVPISATWVSAFNDLEAPGRLKSACAVRAVFQADSGIVPQVGVAIDYYTPVPPAPASAITPQTALWDVAKWDQAIWGGEPGTIGPWVAALGDGYQFATTVAISVIGANPVVNVTCNLVASNILYEPGALLG